MEPLMILFRGGNECNTHYRADNIRTRHCNNNSNYSDESSNGTQKRY